VQKKILVVDDEPNITMVMQEQLELQGYSVIVASDGTEGLEKAKKEKPDLIILDVMLPKMNGYEVCGLLKQDEKYASIPIILFTGRTQDSEKELGKKIGADAHLTKPFGTKMLLETIKKLLNEPTEKPPAQQK